MSRHARRRRAPQILAAALGVGISTLAVSGIAYGYWTASGHGTGTASARSFLAVTVSAGTAPTAELYPGLVANGSGTGGDLVVSASNPNPFPVTVTVTISGTVTGCTTPAVTLGAAASFSLPATSGTVTRTMTDVVSMGTSASNDCQGAQLTVPLATSSVSS